MFQTHIHGIFKCFQRWNRVGQWLRCGRVGARPRISGDPSTPPGAGHATLIFTSAVRDIGSLTRSCIQGGHHQYAAEGHTGNVSELHFRAATVTLQFHPRSFCCITTTPPPPWPRGILPVTSSATEVSPTCQKPRDQARSDKTHQVVH
ncbi:hypothetical protein BD310DRAFT_359120 [Dichomitus squalens]|uniref:Uncharacterized protein n=1 Tax=Dichomitus squalens TaxID=114155 RepID=A0A4Q9Q0J0_9APHY|nr:hypothetical protein BD310DRAFT_359120 [Dichomitus squalens]